MRGKHGNKEWALAWGYGVRSERKLSQCRFCGGLRVCSNVSLFLSAFAKIAKNES